MNTRQQILDLITQLYITGVPDNVSAADIRQGLTALVDREYQLSEIPVSINGISANKLDGALVELFALALRNMSDAEIRNALQGLLGKNRLNKSAIFGGDFSLNRRGKGDVLSGEYQTGMTDILKGDYWIYDTGGAGGSDSLNEGDWVVALRDGVNTFDYTTTDWEVYNFGSGNSTLTAAQISALLNANNTFAEMLKANRVQLEGTELTVKMKLAALDQDILDVYGSISNVTALIESKQTSLLTKRLVYSLPADRFLDVAGITTSIVQMCINRVPYQGIVASEFVDGSSNYDFIYQFTNSDGPKVTIQLHPDLGFNFEPGMLIDIIY